MSFLPEEIDPETGKDGFEICKLGRKATGTRLSTLMETGTQPIVVAIDGGWGTGKSFFLKCWATEHMRTEGNSKVIYFDAFAHDYLDDPLAALLSVALEEAGLEDGEKLERLKKYGWLVAQTVTRAGLAALSAGISEITGNVVDAVVSETSEAAKDAAKDFWENMEHRRNAMEQFRDALKGLVSQQTEAGNGGLIIVVDELDRCRPDFALQTIEVIKHFFSVDGVKFVLGANLAELENAITSRYGSRALADKYLQKFVHASMSLEAGSRSKQQEVLSSYFRELFPPARREGLPFGQTVIDHVECILRDRPIAIRDLQRIYTRTVLTPPCPPYTGLNYSVFVIGSLIILSVLDPSLKRRIGQGEIPADEIINLLVLREIGENGTRNPETGLLSYWPYFLNLSGLPETGNGESFHLHSHRDVPQHQLLSRLVTEYVDAVWLPD